jgi:hypothetical protein
MAVPPRTRADCLGGPRPCPWRACRFNLGPDVRGGGEPAETCALDVADRGGGTLEEIAVVLGLTRERVRQIERGALEKLRGLGVVWEGREA